MDDQFKPDPDVPFDEHPNEEAKRRRRWDLDDEATGLAFGVPHDREADEEERRKIARGLRERDERGSD